MQILFINNQGSGYADHLEVEEGSTVSQLFNRQIKGCKPGDYLNDAGVIVLNSQQRELCLGRFPV